MALEIASRLVLDPKGYIASAKQAQGVNADLQKSIDSVGVSGKRAGSALNDSAKASDKLGAANDDLKNKTDDASDSVEKFTRKTELSASAAAKSVAKYTALAAAVATGVGYAFLDAAREAENYELRLNRLLGSQQEGNRLFRDMTRFAGQVPFAYQEIMASATQLAGVMSGGVDEINQWMPLIADLAAVSGLSIQQTTEQVARMYSAGAASADLFRERGILSMLGFQAGVSYSAEETKAILIDAFESPASRFRGASEDLAASWDGIMSMMSDAWFQFRLNLTDEGVFDYLKELAVILNEELRQGLDESEQSAASWAQSIIEGMGLIIEGGAGVLDFFDIMANGFTQLESSAKTIHNIGINIESLGIYVAKAQGYMTFAGEEYQQHLNRMLLENEASLAANEAAVAENNIKIIERSNRDWSEIAQTIIARAEEAAKRVDEVNDDVVNSNENKNQQIIESNRVASAESIKLIEKEQAAAEKAHKKAVELAQRQLAKVVGSVQTQSEKLSQWYDESVDALEEAQRLGLSSTEDYNRLRERLDEEYQTKLIKLEQDSIKENEKAYREKLKNGGLFGQAQLALYDEWGDAWESIQSGNFDAAKSSFDDIGDAFETMVKQMLLSYAASGIDKLFGLDSSNGGFSFSGLFGGGGGGFNGGGRTPGINGSAGVLGNYSNTLGAASNFYGGYNNIRGGVNEGGTQGLVQAGLGAYQVYSGASALGLIGTTATTTAGIGAGTGVVIGSTAGTAAASTAAATAATTATATTATSAAAGGAAAGGGGSALGALASNPYTWAALAAIAVISSLSGGRSPTKVLRDEFDNLSGVDQQSFAPIGYEIGNSKVTVEGFTGSGNGVFVTGANQNAFANFAKEQGFDIVQSGGGTRADRDGGTQAETDQLIAAFQAAQEALGDFALQSHDVINLVKTDAVDSSHLFLENWTRTFGGTADSAQQMFVGIDQKVDQFVASGVSDMDAFAKAIAQTFNISEESAAAWVDEVGDSARLMVEHMSMASGDAIAELLEINEAGQTVFEQLAAQANTQGGAISIAMANAANQANASLASIRLDRIEATNSADNDGRAGARHFNVGAPRLQSDGLVYAHRDEMIVDANSASFLRNYGIQLNAQGGIDSGSVNRLVNALERVETAVATVAANVEANTTDRRSYGDKRDNKAKVRGMAEVAA